MGWEGPNSTFIEGFQAGQATLDSVRAVLSSENITGVQSDAKVTMWGYSGGALASEWAMELQASYAPELEFVGAAIGGVTPNVPNVYRSINNGPFAGLAGAGLIGMARAFPEFDAALTEQLIPETAAEFYRAGENCFYCNTCPHTSTTETTLSTSRPSQNTSTPTHRWVSTVHHRCRSSFTNQSSTKSLPSPTQMLWSTSSAGRELPSTMSGIMLGSISPKLPPVSRTSSTSSAIGLLV